MDTVFHERWDAFLLILIYDGLHTIFLKEKNPAEHCKKIFPTTFKIENGMFFLIQV